MINHAGRFIYYLLAPQCLKLLVLTCTLLDPVAVAYMQSILQYRRFKRHLKSEVQRHGIDHVTSCATRRDLTSAHDEWQNQHRPQPESQSSQQLDIRDYAQEETQLEKQTSRPELSATASPSIATGTTQRHDDRVPSSNLHSMKDGIPSSGTEQDRDTLAEHEVSHPLQNIGTRLGQLMTGISIQTRASQKDDKNVGGHVFIVGFQGPNDSLNPHNWSKPRRIMCTILIATIGFIVGLASSIDSSAIPQAANEFRVSQVAESLATALFLIGFGCGAFVAAPLSETFGRNPVYLGTGLLYMIFVMASGLSPNIGAQLAFRFLAGLFGSTPLTCAGGSLSDMWNPFERTSMFPFFGFLAFLGPVAVGPVMGGFIAESSVVSWRWVDWVTLIWSGLIFAIVFLFLPETYAPTLLKWKAEHLREMTGDDRYKSEIEVRNESFAKRLLHSLYRPWILMLFEPTIQLFTLYLAVVYIILFTFLTGFPFIFQDTYHISQGLTFLIFVGLGVGFVVTYASAPLLKMRYQRAMHTARAKGLTRVAPEERLFIAMVAAPLIPIGLYWMAWTAYPSVSIWSPIISCVPIGAGTLGIFLASYQYIIDSYEKFAASGLVGLTFVRYAVCGGMIPVSIPFYHNLGVHWTLTILAALSTLLVPVPFFFYRYGHRIRANSRKAVKDEVVVRK